MLPFIAIAQKAIIARISFAKNRLKNHGRNMVLPKSSFLKVDSLEP